MPTYINQQGKALGDNCFVYKTLNTSLASLPYLCYAADASVAVPYVYARSIVSVAVRAFNYLGEYQ